MSMLTYELLKLLRIVLLVLLVPMGFVLVVTLPRSVAPDMLTGFIWLLAFYAAVHYKLRYPT